MLKRISAFFLVFLCLVAMCHVSFADDLNLAAPSVILVESQTGQVLFEKNAHEKLPPASVTKIMTMLLTIEAVDSGQIKMEDMVTCTEEAASMGGSQVYLEEGEQMSVHDMLKAVAVASGNDAAVALACHLAGSHEGFVKKMNERAKELGMENTNFVNCNGLDDENHYTTAYDISVMSRELISHPRIFEFTSIWMDSLRNGDFGLVNTNKLIRFYEGANGLKTGSTSVAKYCLSASAKRNDMNLIAVIMAAPTSKERFADATKLLDYGFANYAIANSLVTDEDLTEIKVKKGAENIVNPGAKEQTGVLVSKDKLNSIEKRLSIPEEIEAPIAKGQKIGEIEFFIDGNKVGGTDLVALKDIKKVNPLQMFVRLANTMMYG
ncbi:MAG: D-alanyl-D-alanine carboxypeptidase [Clostridia bacterium]|nr:D-alanyl-D-alanine carboxypeptidase [Clostridia bacterium]MBR6646938.1 D-alanyl-D-alanine carboxypeptidase [Clostridia bacterium]